MSERFKQFLLCFVWQQRDLKMSRATPVLKWRHTTVTRYFLCARGARLYHRCISFKLSAESSAESLSVIYPRPPTQKLRLGTL